MRSELKIPPASRRVSQIRVDTEAPVGLRRQGTLVQDEGMASTNEHWVSVDVVAQHLGVARDTVYRWIDARRLPAHRIGRIWKFKLTEIDKWVCNAMTSAPQATEGNDDSSK